MEKCECLACGCVVEPQIEERTEILPVRGEDTAVLTKVGVCRECGADMSIEELDDATLVAAFNLYRQKHDLMAPEEIRRLRERYGLSVRAFSLLLGWGEITAHRYECGSLQDPAHDAALRLAEDPANIRIYLKVNGHKLTTRQLAGLKRHLRAMEAEAPPCCPDANERFVAREETDVYGGWTPMQLSKLREMMVFFSTLPNMYVTKLNKLLFYSDFGYFRDFGASISGSPYLVMQFGPVPQHYDWIWKDLVKGDALASEEIFFDDGAGVVLTAMREPDLSLFSPDEVARLNHVAHALGRKTSKRLSELSHEETAWRSTARLSMISYELARDLSF